MAGCTSGIFGSFWSGYGSSHDEDSEGTSGIDRSRGRADAEPQVSPEEVEMALDHLNISFMRRFTKIMFNPTNPFIAGASVLGSVVACQTAYMQGTYEPLPHPQEDRSCGFEAYEMPSGEPAQVTKRLLVLGDSLVIGVGCDEAPLMGQSLAKGMSTKLRNNVAWRSMGIDGGDARTIHSTVIEDVRLAVNGAALTQLGNRWHGERCRCARVDHEDEFIGTAGVPDSSGAVQRVKIDVCVVLCGLNDFKRLWKGRTATVFRRDLLNFLTELRSVLGPECLLVLPALPLEPTRFPEPLRSFVIYIAEVYDEMKAELARELAMTSFIPKPTVRWWRRVHEKHGGVISADGVHPNEVGYVVFGKWLGQVIAKGLASRRDTIAARIAASQSPIGTSRSPIGTAQSPIGTRGCAHGHEHGHGHEHQRAAGSGVA